MLLCTYLNADNIAAPLFGNKTMLCKLLLNSVGVCALLINLVDCNDYAYLCRLCVVNSFNCLRHDTIICRNNKDSNIRYKCTAGTHSRKCFMTGSIKESNLIAVDVYHISTDVLGNTACFACSNIGAPDCIEKTCLTMVNVSHNADNGGTGKKVFFFVGSFSIAEKLFLLCYNDFSLNLCTHILGNKSRYIVFDILRNSCHNTKLH